MAASSDGSVLTGTAGPSLQQCVERFSEGKVDQVCNDKTLMQFAEKFHDFDKLSVYLGLTEVESEDIKQKFPRSPEMQRFDMLRKWKEKKQKKATYRLLAKTLSEAKNFLLIDELCELVENVSDESHHKKKEPQVQELSQEQMKAILSKPSIHKLNKLHKLSSMWYVLGVELKVKTETLRTIEKTNSNNAVRMVRMFEEWLKFCKSPSFLMLIKAVDMFEMTDIAEEICKQRGASLDAVKAFIESQPDSQSESEEEEQDSTQSEIPVEESPCTREPNSQDLDTQSKSLVSQSTPLPPRPPECVLKYAEYLKCKYKAMSELPSPNWPPSIKVPVKIAVIDRTQPGINAEGGENESGDDFDMEDFHDHESMQHDYLHGKIDSITGYKKEIQLEDVFIPKQNKSPLKVLMDGAPGVGKTTQTKKACIGWANGKMLQQFHLVILVPLREASNRRVNCLEKLFPADDPELREQVIKCIQQMSGKHILIIFDGYDELSVKERNKDSFFLDVIKGDILSQCNVLVTSRPYASHSLQRLESINRHVEVLGFTEKQIEKCIMENLPESKAKELCRKLQERLDVASLCYVPINCAIVVQVYKVHNYTLPNTLTELYTKFLLFCLKREAICVKRDEEMEKELCSLQEAELPEKIKKQLDALCKMAYLGLSEDKLVFSYRDLKASFSDCCDLLSDGMGIESCCFGLVTSVLSFTSSGEEYHYQFLHLSIQEYLAARYVANCMSCEEQVFFFNQYFSDTRFHLVLLFLVGHTKSLPVSFPCLTVDNKGCLNVQQQEFLRMCHLVLESQKCSEFYPMVLQCLPNKEKLTFSSTKLTLFDCVVIAHFLSLTNHSWKTIDLSKCCLSSRSIEVFRDVFCGYRKSQTSCEILDLTGNMPSLANSVFLVPWKTTEILCTDLNDFYYSDIDQFPISEAVQTDDNSVLSCHCTMSQTLQRLEIEQCSLLVKSIVVRLGNNETLKTLHIWKVDVSDVLSICQALEQNSSLTELGVSWHKSDPKDRSVGHAISRLLRAATSIEILKLNDDITLLAKSSSFDLNRWFVSKLENVLSDDELADILSAACSSNCILRSLYLCDIELVRTLPDGMWDLSPHYYDLYRQQEQFTTSRIGSYRRHKTLLPQFFCVAIQGTFKIPFLDKKVIELQRSDISSSRAITIFQCMTYNTNVEELDLSHNDQMPLNNSAEVAEAIKQMIENNTTLQKLNLSGKCVDDCIASSIACALEKNVTLKELNLDMNTVSESSVLRILSSIAVSTTLSSLTLCGVSLTINRPRIVWRVVKADRNTIACRTHNEELPDFFCILNSTSIRVVLSSLDLSNAKITSDTAICVLHSILDHIVNLSHLCLSKNEQIANSDSKGFSVALKNLLASSKTLQVLDIEKCALNDTVAEEIAEGLTQSRTLEKLVISDNLLSVCGIAKILSGAHLSAKCNTIQVSSCHYLAYEQSEDFWKLEECESWLLIKPEYSQVLNVLKAIALSSMNVRMKSFWFIASGRTPINSVLLPPAEEITQSFSVLSESGFHDFELTTSLELFPDCNDIIQGLLSITCRFKSSLNKEVIWKATIQIELTSCNRCYFSGEDDTVVVQIKVDLIPGNLLTEEASLTNWCDLVEEIIMKKLQPELRLSTMKQIECQHPIQCEDIITTVIRDSETCMHNTVCFRSCSISDTAVQSIASKLKDDKVVKSIVLDQIKASPSIFSSIFQSLECNESNVQEFVISTQVKISWEEREAFCVAVEKLLKGNSTLEKLSISVELFMLKSIAKGMENNTTLKELELHCSESYKLCLSSNSVAGVLSSASASNLSQLSFPSHGVCLCRTDPQSVWQVIFMKVHGVYSHTRHEIYYAIVQSTMNVHEVFLNLRDISGLLTNNCIICMSKLHLEYRTYQDCRIDTTVSDVSNAIENMLETSVTLTQLHINCNTLPNSLSEHIGAGIRKSMSLKTLKLSADITTLNEILRSLNDNTYLEELIVTIKMNDSNNGEIESDTCIRFEVDSLLSANSNIKKIKILPEITVCEETGDCYVHPCTLKHSDTLNMLKSLYQDSNSSIQELTISWADTATAESMSIGPACEKVLTKNTVLKVLDFQYTEFSDHTAKCIAAGLKDNSSLNTLILNASLLSDQCPLKDVTIAAIHSSAISSNLCSVVYSDVINFCRLNAQDTKWDMTHNPKNNDFKWPPKLITALGQSRMQITNTRCDTVLSIATVHVASSRMAKILQSLQALNMKQISLTWTDSKDILPKTNDSEPDIDIEMMERACENLLAENTTLETLEFTSCNMLFEHDSIVVQFAMGLTSSNVKRLILVDCGITASGVVAIIQAVRSNTTLEVLSLYNQKQEQEWSTGSTSKDLGPAFEEMLKSNTTLKELCLKGLGVADVVITHIFRVLCSNQSLEKLNVSGTIPDAEYIETLAQLLKKNTTLTDLCITLPCDWYMHFDHIQVVRALQNNTSLKCLEIKPHRPLTPDHVSIRCQHFVDSRTRDIIRLPFEAWYGVGHTKEFFEEEMEALRRLEKSDSCTSQLTITELQCQAF